ncbi:MAG: universal stress protein [Saprospiraceae bacterium]|nr:universal stress protein [Saprospiraceae bacterium]MDW8229336.1 universal stress protein [Saprospiraceae bacterium]
MKKILVPTDFSANARHAARVAAIIARETKARVTLLHVNTAIAYTPPLPDYSVPQAFDLEGYRENAAEALHALKKELSETEGFAEVPFESAVEEGFLHQAIRRIAEEDAVDLVVMGTKGATGAVEFFLGSNTEKVIRTAPCAVLAVPESTRAFHWKTVVVPSTLRPDQARVFEWLAEWQAYFLFDVWVLYLNDPLGLVNNHAIEKKAHEMTREAGLQRCSVLIGGNTFNEELAILEVAHERQADIIAMGTHQRQGLSHLLFGSLTEDMANHSDIPVLSIPLKK